MTEPSLPSPLKRIIRRLHQLEDGLLVAILLTMIGMAATQILMRNLVGGAVIWGDVLVRVLVLWIGMAGAMIASRRGEHIRIDLASRYLPENAKRWVDASVCLFTALTCTLVAYHAVRFVQMEYEFGGNAFARVPSWVCESIIPFGFLIIALRYYLLSVLHLRGETIGGRSR